MNKLACLFTITAILLPLTATTVTLHVPNPYPTLEAAVNAAADCDTIILAKGTYRGEGFKNLRLDNRCLTITSAAGPDSTVLDSVYPFLIISDTLFAGEDFVTICDLGFEGCWIRYDHGGRADIINCRGSDFRIRDKVPSGHGRIDSCIFASGSVSTVDSVHQTISNNVFIGGGYYGQWAPGGAIIDNIFTLSEYTSLVAYACNGITIARNVFVSNGTGIDDDNFSSDVSVIDNCFWNNDRISFNFPHVFPENGNIFADPRFCNLPIGDRLVMADSPLLPENNGGVHIGNVTLGCRCGDIDNSGDPAPTLSDLTYLIDYIFRGGPSPASLESADVDGSDTAGDQSAIPTVADLTYLIRYLFRSGPAPIC